jgi:hypothetical protein
VYTDGKMLPPRLSQIVVLGLRLLLAVSAAAFRSSAVQTKA